MVILHDIALMFTERLTRLLNNKYNVTNFSDYHNNAQPELKPALDLARGLT